MSILRRELNNTANTRQVLFDGAMTTNSAASQQSLLPQTIPRPVFGQSVDAMYHSPNVPSTAATQLVTWMPAAPSSSLGSSLARQLGAPLASGLQTAASRTDGIKHGAAFGGSALGPRSSANWRMTTLTSGPSLTKRPAPPLAPVSYSDNPIRPSLYSAGPGGSAHQAREVVVIMDEDDDDDDVVIVDHK